MGVNERWGKVLRATAGALSQFGFNALSLQKMFKTGRIRLCDWAEKGFAPPRPYLDLALLSISPRFDDSWTEEQIIKQYQSEALNQEGSELVSYMQELRKGAKLQIS